MNETMTRKSTAGKYLALLGAALLLVVSLGLTGCSGSNSEGSAGDAMTGTWTLSGIEAQGVEMPESYVKSYLEALGEDNLTITFNADKSVEMSFAGESADGAKYTFDDGKGTIDDGKTQMDFEMTDGKLKIESSGVTMIFNK